MLYRISNFQGEIPRMHPRLLGESYAQRAIDTRLEAGDLTPLNATASVTSLDADAGSIYRHDGEWLGWPGLVHVAPGPVATDRLYITGNGAPDLRVGGVTYPLALAAPPAKLTAAAATAPDPDLVEDVIYAYTYLTEFDEESAPSPFADPVQWSSGVNVDLTGFTVPTPGRGVNRFRIYRSQTSALGITSLFFVKEVSAATSALTHDSVVDPIQEPITTTDYDPPPDGMAGIIAMPNGMMAAFSGKELLFSEPYIPHAWPAKYALKTDSEIVGLASFGSSIAVMTKGKPYVAQGTGPASMTMARVEVNLPCIAAAGIADLGYLVVYPSTEGLVTISSAGAQLVSQSLFSRKDWARLNAETFVAGQHIGRYIASYQPDGANVRELLILDMTGMQPFLMRSAVAPDAMFFEVGSGRLFLLVGTRDIREWDSLDAPVLPQTWRSRLYSLPTATNFGALLIEGEPTDGAASLSAKVYADGVLVHTSSVWNTPVRLPADRLAKQWEIEITGTLTVSAISFANSMDELTR